MFGFRPPPDRVYNDLVAIRKIALKLRTTDSVQYLIFDYFTKRNIQINKNWVVKRKVILQKLIKRFEDSLAKKTRVLKQKLAREIDRLHSKRRLQLDHLMTKYRRCKNLIAEINAKEKQKFRTQKKKFQMKNEIPRVNFKREVPLPSKRKIELKSWSDQSLELMNPEDIPLDETIRDRATGQTLMSIAQSVMSRQRELLRRRTTLYEGLMKGIQESDEDLYSKMN